MYSGESGGMTRPTQAERSAATQAALIDAAIALLIERGWAATTAVAVCERAGLTRGALVHHYASLSSLFAHAIESLYDDFVRPSAPPAMTVSGLLEGAWSAVSDRRFKAVIEAWTAAGNDPAIAVELRPTIAKWSKLVSPAAGRASLLRDAEARALYMTAREAMIGLALGRAINNGKPLPHEPIVLRRLRAEAAALDARMGRAERP